jgi:3-hydroxyisobutyrate dehydrogenase
LVDVHANTGMPGRTLAFIGLGQMGLPMAKRLVAAGFEVRGADISDEARRSFEACGGISFPTAREAAAGVGVLITMLPNGAIVRDVLLGSGGVGDVLHPNSLVIDMSSSAPFATRALGDELGLRGIEMIDAPVSGGVARAVTGELAIMVGGIAANVERSRAILAAMGTSIFAVGGLGAGHAIKALNNFVSAAGLVAASEAVIVGRAFGLQPETIVDVLNASTGRNNSTEKKMKPFVLSGAFDSGFSMSLMAKDIGTASDMAKQLDCVLPNLAAAPVLWQDASAQMGRTADHTEIYAYLERLHGAKSA